MFLVCLFVVCCFEFGVLCGLGRLFFCVCGCVGSWVVRGGVEFGGCEFVFVVVCDVVF